MTLERIIKQFLTDQSLRFTKIRYRSKRPIEKGWTKRPYTYDQILPHIGHHTNYGVLTGYGHLAVADADTEEMAELIEKKLPTTFTVQTGSGGRHYYYKCPGLQKRIVLQADKAHHGEIQSKGQAVVGPGSLHPSGRIYKVVRDITISTINTASLRDALSDYIPRRYQEQSHVRLSHLNMHRPAAEDLRITDVIDLSNFKKAANGEYYGPNPWHGSTSGANTWVNVEKNVAYCFRHSAGISVAKAIALNQGLLPDCSSPLPWKQS